MFDVLAKVLTSAEGVYPPVFSFDDVSRWPPGELERCVAAGLLRPGQSATVLTCPECGESEEVFLLQDSLTKQSHAYVRCGEVGPVEIPGERLRLWELTFTQLMDTVFAGVALTGLREEIVRDRVWRLGKTRWASASRNVYFARGLHRRDTWQVIHQAKLTPRSVVFVPARLPEIDARVDAMPLVIPLTAAVSWENDALHFDQSYVEAEIAGTLATLDRQTADKPHTAPRGSRLVVIEMLTREMQEHLRAARDHAVDTLNRTGTPQLLPRPQRDFLARKIGVHKSRITRAFQDSEARQLRYLWDLANDLDRILEHAGCRN
jgi:predicted RNA-binding Zn-ribbon protein involved in translation (DUF1610 family)